MPYVDDDVIYLDDGTPAGQIVEADDGNYVAVDLDGNILDAAAPDGTPLDPSVYELDTGDDIAEMQARVAELEQATIAQQQHLDAQQYTQQPPYDPDNDVRILEANFNQLEQAKGRPLTSKEVHAVMTGLQGQVDAGRDIDFDKAAEQAQIKPHTDMNHAERVQWMSQRLHENKHEGYPGPVPARDSYDLDDPQQRHQWGADRLSGALSDEDAKAVAYSSSDEPEAA